MWRFTKKIVSAKMSMKLLLAILLMRFHQAALHRIKVYGYGGPLPEFEGHISNVTFSAGRDATLICTVKNLGNYKVGWLRSLDQAVLALQGRVVTHNSRISASHEDFTVWRLRIKGLHESDEGCYMCQINSNPMKKQIGCITVHVPPDFINEESSSDVSALEGQTARLKCQASGRPPPRITWRREDNDPIILRKADSRETIKTDIFNGTILDLARLDRKQMGTYLCIASNDVPPTVSKRITLNVNFSPSIHAPSQLLGAPLGSNVELNCHVESSPGSVSYWLKGGRMPNTGSSSNSDKFAAEFLGGGFAVNGGFSGGDGFIASGDGISSEVKCNDGLETGNSQEMLLDGQHHIQDRHFNMKTTGQKYEITEEQFGYRSLMRLTIRKFSQSDIGTYQCVSTNSLGRAEGTLRLYEIKIHPGSTVTDLDELHIIGEAYAEATKDRNNSSAISGQIRITTTIIFVLGLVLISLFWDNY